MLYDKIHHNVHVNEYTKSVEPSPKVHVHVCKKHILMMTRYMYMYMETVILADFIMPGIQQPIIVIISIIYSPYLLRTF